MVEFPWFKYDCGCQALDEGSLGMKKNGRRLVIAPSSMAYGQDSKHGKVSADSVVAFEIEVVRVCNNGSSKS